MSRKPVVAVAQAIVVSSLAMTLVSAGGVTQVSTEARAAIFDRFPAPQQQPLYDVADEINGMKVGGN